MVIFEGREKRGKKARLELLLGSAGSLGGMGLLVENDSHSSAFRERGCVLVRFTIAVMKHRD